MAKNTLLPAEMNTRQKSSRARLIVALAIGAALMAGGFYLAYRIQMKSGSLIPIPISALILACIISAALFAMLWLLAFVFIREQRRAKADSENLRVREEQLRLTLAHSDISSFRYDMRSGTAVFETDSEHIFGPESVIPNVPESIIAMGLIPEDSVDDFRGFFSCMLSGGPSGQLVLPLGNDPTGYAWYRMEYTLVYASDGKPYYAIVTYEDFTSKREMELAYERWKQEIISMPKKKTSLFEWDLTHDRSEGEVGGLIEYFENLPTFDARTRAYAEDRVFQDDRAVYTALLNRERLLGAFHEGIRYHQMDFREISGNCVRWMRLSVELVRYPASGYIKAYLIIKDIDDEKNASLRIAARARQDALTGTLNRGTFIDEVNALIASGSKRQHAFIMIDLDGFKRVNDSFGHTEGDKLLLDVSSRLKSLLRDGDLIGRIGGDEFMLCLKDIPHAGILAPRIEQIQEGIHAVFSGGIMVSASIGVAVYPFDGHDFSELYHNADIAMYRAKQMGRDRYALFNPNLAEPEADEKGAALPS